ncbi:MAG: DUF1287 domain-containing protein [Lachnospiraceae bacterium]|nr:DUF1287 domain-containing protein [Lachnospiraceae bacterium]
MKKRLVIWGMVLLFFIIAGFITAWHFNLLPEKSYGAEDFGIAWIQSSVDFNGNGIDDYTDILSGAKIEAKNHPRYNGAYFQGGYPPDNIGVCTDVIWRSFRHAGYNLKEMIDADILARPEAYTEIIEPDTNIDFRRVRNLKVFFDTYAQPLTLDIEEIKEWQPGDIVIFGENEHIGIVSNRRNKKGRPYIIHNAGQPNRDEDYMKWSWLKITGHYRFDASLIEEEVLIPWK